nr:polysaccharide biosynthesis/export family protein [Sphingobium subterraneum]
MTPNVAAAQQAAARAQPGSPSYRINAGDEIEVYVWGEERLQRVIRVLPDGTFSFPLAGQIMAQGQLPSQLEAAISKGLESQYRGQVPQVTVSVKSPSGLQFSVVGKVKGAGTFTPGRFVNLLEALSLAGGADEFANLDNISIIRKTANGPVIIKGRLGSVLKGNVSQQDLARGIIPDIESGDTVIVP